MLQKILFIVIALTLSACTHKMPSSMENATWPEQKAIAEELTEWRMEGKLAITHHNKSNTARINWLQQPHQFELSIVGPLGQGAVEIKSHGKKTIVTTQNEEKLIHGDLAQYLQKHYGWSIPVEHLKYWIRGLPGPSSHYQQDLDANGYPATIKQDGWTIHYDGFRVAENMAVLLPSRLSADHKDYHLKIVVQSWRDLSTDKLATEELATDKPTIDNPTIDNRVQD